MQHRIKRADIIRLSDGAELEVFVYDEDDTFYEALLIEGGTFEILKFFKSTLEEAQGKYLIHIHHEKETTRQESP